MSAQEITQATLEYAEKRLLNSKRILSIAIKLAFTLVISTLIVAPFYLARRGAWLPQGTSLKPVPSTHDMGQHLAVMYQFDKAVRSGIPYPRWQPEFNNGYGLPWLNYYPPGTFYLTEGIYLITGDWIDALLLFSILSMAASGLTFYSFARLFYSRAASASGALLYMLAPYHTLDLYWRGALPEFVGFAFVPMVLYFAFKAGEYGRARYYAGLGLFHGLYLITHFPVAYLMTLTLGFYALIWTIIKKDIRVALRIGVAVAIALLLSAIFWVPAVVESDLVKEPFSALFQYHRSYITLMPGGDNFGKLVNNSFVFLALAMIVAHMTLYTARQADMTGLSGGGREGISSSATQTRFFKILSLATIFMVTPYSIYISELIPKINSVSFAWRWLVIVCFFTALVVAAATDCLVKRREWRTTKVWAYRAAIAAVFLANVWISIHAVMLEAFGNPNLDAPANRTEMGFVPIAGVDPTALPETQNFSFLSGTGTIEQLSWEPLYRAANLALREQSAIKVKTYNFPGWLAQIDGQPAKVLNDVTGAQVITVPPGDHRLEVFFVNTPVRNTGTILSSVAFVIICGLLAFDLLRRSQRTTTPP